MKSTETVKKYLDDLNIEYKIVKHPAAETIEEADAYIEGHEGARTKTILITNKKRTNYYMLIINDDRQVDLKALRDKLEDSRLTLASEDRISEKLDSKPGIVTLFSLLDNEEKDVHVIFDQEMMVTEDILTFHPNINTETLFIKKEDALKYLENLGISYQTLDLQG